MLKWIWLKRVFFSRTYYLLKIRTIDLILEVTILVDHLNLSSKGLYYVSIDLLTVSDKNCGIPTQFRFRALTNKKFLEEYNILPLGSAIGKTLNISILFGHSD